MKKLCCSSCGVEVSEQDVLGVGVFDKHIGKYAGLTVVTFVCPSCHQKEYQVVERNPFTNTAEIAVHPELTSEELMVAQRDGGISCNDLLDFYENIQKINSVDDFLIKCSQGRFERMTNVGQIVKTPTDVFNLFMKYNGPDKKRMMILVLDEDSRLITWELLGEGTSKRINFDPKTIFKTALMLPQKVSIILAHNHFTTLTNPSKKDILRTKRLVKAGEVLDINFLDHVVIHQEGYKSFEQLNLL